MIQVPLSRGLFAIIDESDGELILRHKWTARENTGRFYAMRKTSERNGKVPRYIHMHRLLIDAKHGEQVDHINGNGLDNRRCNLRIVTQSVNQANTRTQKRTMSKFKGVHSTGEPDRYAACIRRDGKRFKSRRFKDHHKAALLRDEMARLLYPEGVYLNFPDEQCPSDLKEYAEQLIAKLTK